jgi:hypothetical protein
MYVEELFAQWIDGETSLVGKKTGFRCGVKRQAYL